MTNIFLSSINQSIIRSVDRCNDRSTQEFQVIWFIFGESTSIRLKQSSQSKGSGRRNNIPMQTASREYPISFSSSWKKNLLRAEIAAFGVGSLAKKSHMCGDLVDDILRAKLQPVDVLAQRRKVDDKVVQFAPEQMRKLRVILEEMRNTTRRCSHEKCTGVSLGVARPLGCSRWDDDRVFPDGALVLWSTHLKKHNQSIDRSINLTNNA